MSQAVELQMLAALEHLYYASRFQGELFMLCLQEGELDELLSDIRVLRQARIRLLVIAQERIAPEKILEFEKLGMPLALSTDSRFSGVDKELTEGMLPVVEGPLKLDEVFALAAELKPSKLFFLGEQQGLFKEGRLLPFATYDQVRRLEGQEERISRICNLAQSQGLELVFLRARSGNLFLEIFTHQGRGTLVNEGTQEELRPARQKEVMDISLLMKPYVLSKQILPISLEEISKEIDDYFVAIVNGELVASARLKNHGEEVELSKLCTLPRYQGKGMARDLCNAVIREAKKRGAKAVFALSVIEELGVFFKSLGMGEVPRESLPARWREGYDLSRPSKAYRIEI